MSISIILYLKKERIQISRWQGHTLRRRELINQRTCRLMEQNTEAGRQFRSSRSTLHAPLHHFANSERVAGTESFNFVR